MTLSIAYVIARRLLQRGMPLPLDIVFRLSAEGVDVSEMERRFAQ